MRCSTSLHFQLQPKALNASSW